MLALAGMIEPAPEVDAMNAFALPGVVPGWLVLAAAAVAAVAVFVLLFRAQSFRLPVLVLGLIGLLVVGYGLLLLYQKQLAEQAVREEGRALQLRATQLDGALAASGLACIDTLPDMAASCEAVVFARPQTVVAARALVRARLLLLTDADALLRRAPAADLAALVEVWRQPLARDPFGLVAEVMRQDFSCTDQNCAPARLLGEDAPAVANLSNRRFAAVQAAHAAQWRAAGDQEPVAPLPPPAGETAAPQAVPAPAAEERGPAPAEVPGQGAPVAATAPEASPLPAAAAPLPPQRPAIPAVTRAQPAAPRPLPRPPVPPEAPESTGQ
ncbi:hypothetical protein V5F38_08165 [Xanthobacter sp. V0B-10]|uniref:hypothetical protein n=1 Tax=Xanthobacter albus TaxID=3119929 RepID=UPI00372C0D3D